MKKSLLLFVLPFVIFSCGKKKVDNETVSTTDFAFATQEFLQVFINMNASAVSRGGLYVPPLQAAATPGRSDSLSGDTTHDAQGIFTNSGNLPTLWIRYSNCAGGDGKSRSGIIKAVFDRQYSLTTCTATLSLVNYTVNGNLFSGTFAIIRNSNNQFVFSSSDAQCVTEGKAIGYACNYVLALFTPYTSSCSNCEYTQATGIANCTNREGKTFHANITEPLRKETSCSWISKGIVCITPSALHSRTIDFGNGSCDDIAVFTVDGQTYTVHLSK